MFTVHIDSNRTWGGGQEQSLGLAQALAGRGHEAYLITQRGSALEDRLREMGGFRGALSKQPGDLRWESMPLRGLIGAGYSLRLDRRLRQLRPDVVHLHDSAAQLPAMLAAVRRGRSRPRVIATRRNDFPVPRGMRAVLYRRLCDRVICVSEAVLERLLEANVPAERLVVIPDFVDCQRFDPSLFQAGCPGSALAQRPPTIVSVGRLTREKGHAVLLGAMAKAKCSMPHARLLICGTGPEEAALARQAEQVTQGVEFLGFVSDVRPVLAAADLFAMPSLSEGLGVAALEAMAMAKPVVASATGGLRELVLDSETGLLVPPGDADALAEGLLVLLRDPARAQRMGQAGRQRALAHYDRGLIVDRVLALYREVVSGS